MTDTKLIHADCLEAMRAMEADTFDAIVTDPPYGLVQNKRGGSGVASVDLSTPYGRARIGAGNGPGGFMGKEWDSCVPGVEFWTEALRVAKPGAHLVAFGGTRTFHRLACAIEDAGWEVRDCLSWLYGSGFPKSLDVSKAIDKAAGAERVGGRPYRTPEGGQELSTFNNWQANSMAAGSQGRRKTMVTDPVTDAAKQWEGWGTALKPAWEPIILARKPLVSTVASNVLAHGTGALNVDGCRIETADNLNGGAYSDGGRSALPGDERDAAAAGMFAAGGGRLPGEYKQPSGRWPANVVLSHTLWCEHETKDGREVWSCDEGCPVKMLNAQTGTLTSGDVAGSVRRSNGGNGVTHGVVGHSYADSGGASRFFYCAKASRSERGEGNSHPTVKPLALMRWLAKLVCPPGGTILDPFAGSGTTLLAAQEEGFSAVGIEREAEYVEIAKKRIERTGR